MRGFCACADSASVLNTNAAANDLAFMTICLSDYCVPSKFSVHYDTHPILNDAPSGGSRTIVLWAMRLAAR